MLTERSTGKPPLVENIYKVSRRIKKSEHTLYNALRSIYEDSRFVQEIHNLWKDLHWFANLRCGLWYAPEFDGTCYFKSTDGHNGNWSFSTARLNLHVAQLAAERGGCCIVDATRKGKRFPDSMSKTIPIWACVLNRTLADLCLPQMQEIFSSSRETVEQSSGSYRQENVGNEFSRDCWDCSLHLPLWVSHVERANIESQIEVWVKLLKSTGVHLAALAKQLKKPLRPLWISQKTVIWLNEVPDVEDWPFTPIILVSASRPSLFTQRLTDAEFSWSYIPGAADDEESWARGLTPALFWKNSRDILSCGPSTCNRKVANIVESDRVYRAVRGQHAPQVRTKFVQLRKEPVTEVADHLPSVNSKQENQCYSSLLKASKNEPIEVAKEAATFRLMQIKDKLEGIGDSIVIPEMKVGPSIPHRVSFRSKPGLHWIGNTQLAVGNADSGNRDGIYNVVDCFINCGTSSSPTSINHLDSYLYLPIVGPKFDRYSLQKNLAEAISFARKKLILKSTTLVYCSNGEDISVCVCLAILLSCFNSNGEFEGEPELSLKVVKKSDVRERLIYLASFNSDARPSRGSLRQVFNFFNASGPRDNDLL